MLNNLCFMIQCPSSLFRHIPFVFLLKVFLICQNCLLLNKTFLQRSTTPFNRLDREAKSGTRNIVWPHPFSCAEHCAQCNWGRDHESVWAYFSSFLQRAVNNANHPTTLGLRQGPWIFYECEGQNSGLQRAQCKALHCITYIRVSERF